jgi:hypothetical protein
MNWNQKWKTKRDGWSPAKERELKELMHIAIQKSQYFNTELSELGLNVKGIKSDGNCFYRAVLDQLNNNGITHYSDGNQAKKLDYTLLRKIAVDYIEKNPKFFDDVQFEAASSQRPAPIGGAFKTRKSYLAGHSKDEEYADEVIITSLSRALGVNLVIIQKEADPIIQNQGKDKHTLYLYYVNGNHYNSLRPNNGNANFKELEDLVAKHPIDEVKTPAGKVHLMTQEAYDLSIKKNPEKNKDATVQFQSKAAKHIEDSSKVIIGDLAKAESIIDTIAKEAGHKIDPSLKTLLAEDLQYNLHHKEDPKMLVKNLYEYMKELKALPQHSSSSVVDSMKNAKQSLSSEVPHISKKSHNSEGR